MVFPISLHRGMNSFINQVVVTKFQALEYDTDFILLVHVENT